VRDAHYTRPKRIELPTPHPNHESAYVQAAISCLGCDKRLKIAIPVIILR
jgi:hypothetical protein